MFGLPKIKYRPTAGHLIRHYNNNLNPSVRIIQFKLRFVSLILIATALPGRGQVMSPMDTLYASDSLGFTNRIILKPIQWWQHFSYNEPSMNCQFSSSCSNFMVEAILERGLIGGSIIGTDRIVRCNPAARYYQRQLPNGQIQFDGRLVDPLDWTKETNPGKSPALAVSLSIVPGLGRVYTGHSVDGFLSLILVSAFAYNTYNHHDAGNSVRAGINASLMTLFWMADIYGAYRSASMSASTGNNP